MIKYQLKCKSKHSFEGWFSNSSDYDQQADKGLLECPMCGSSEIEKALMAPAVARSGSISRTSAQEERLSQIKGEVAAAAKKAREYIDKNFDNVGKKFPEEARRIHYGETKKRDIVGQASAEEVSDLIEEGVPVAPVPEVVPEPGEIKKKLN